jgi:hypothetical protein
MDDPFESFPFQEVLHILDFALFSVEVSQLAVEFQLALGKEHAQLFLEP